MRIGPETVAVVTGGARGIGLALAGELSHRGARIVLLDVDGAGLELALASLPGALGHACDVSDRSAVAAAVARVAEWSERVHLLVNNAGVSVSGSVEESPLEDLEHVFAVNFWGIVHCSRAFLPLLRSSVESGGAVICNMLSALSLLAVPVKSGYSASKHAASGLSLAMAAELDGHGVRVVAAYPGTTATDLVRRGRAVDTVKHRLETEHLSRGLPPEAVAARIVRGIERDRRRIVIGTDARVIDVASRLSPTLTAWAVRRLWRRVPFL